jgi:Pyruvate/2-oxoacid:ferredoxin oxidoreductase gamma subunit
LTKLPVPILYGFVGQGTATLRHVLLDIAIAQGEAVVQPHIVTDVLGGESMALIQVGSR